MSLRFAIIKLIKTAVGKEWEDIVYELDEADVVANLQEKIEQRLLDIRPKKYLEPKYTKDEVKAALRVAFKDIVSDFKKITIRIM